MLGDVVMGVPQALLVRDLGGDGRAHVSRCLNIPPDIGQVSGPQMGRPCPRRDLWPRRETFLIITAQGGGATGTQRAEARDAATHPRVPRQRVLAEVTPLWL